MPNVLFNSGSRIDEKRKEKSGLFFIEELFEGESYHKAPNSLRKKIDKDDIQSIEIGIKSYFSIPDSSKTMFKSFDHFKGVLNEAGIILEQYFKR